VSGPAAKVSAPIKIHHAAAIKNLGDVLRLPLPILLKNLRLGLGYQSRQHTRRVANSFLGWCAARRCALESGFWETSPRRCAEKPNLPRSRHHRHFGDYFRSARYAEAIEFRSPAPSHSWPRTRHHSSRVRRSPSMAATRSNEPRERVPGSPCLNAETWPPEPFACLQRALLLRVHRHPPMQLHPVADQCRRHRQFMQRGRQAFAHVRAVRPKLEDV
jgi:hypothetical protein